MRCWAGRPKHRSLETGRIIVAAVGGAGLAGLIVIAIAGGFGRKEALRATLRPIRPTLAIAAEAPTASVETPAPKPTVEPVDAAAPDVRAPAPIATIPRVEPSASSHPPAPPACDPPYTIDQYNTRIPKPECM